MNSIPTNTLVDKATETRAAAIEFVEEDDQALVVRIGETAAHAAQRIRHGASARVPEPVRPAAAKTGVHLADEPVLAEGRIEMLWYLREQSISHDYHRYGNHGLRANEDRREPA